MKHATKLSLAMALYLWVPAVSQADARTYRVDENGHATFVSEAPLETMTGKTNEVSGSVTVDPTDITKTTGRFKAPVASLRTGNDLRDEHLQSDSWLDAEKNPFIHFEISEVVLGKKGKAELKEKKEAKVQVRGKFTAHGITKLVLAKGTVKLSGDTIHIKAGFPIKLTDHDISVPAIVRLKVANEMAVSVDLQAKSR